MILGLTASCHCVVAPGCVRDQVGACSQAPCYSFSGWAGAELLCCITRRARLRGVFGTRSGLAAGTLPEPLWVGGCRTPFLRSPASSSVYPPASLHELPGSPPCVSLLPPPSTGSSFLFLGRPWKASSCLPSGTGFSLFAQAVFSLVPFVSSLLFLLRCLDVTGIGSFQRRRQTITRNHRRQPREHLARMV